ncbi:hypothetical protein ACW2Q0_04930 [Nocardia sp. R16R-3T]
MGIPDEHHLMLVFAERWARFGGGHAEDILVTFGLADDIFFARVRQLLRRYPDFLDRETADVVERVARSRQADFPAPDLRLRTAGADRYR